MLLFLSYQIAFVEFVMPITCSGSVWWSWKKEPSPASLSITTLALPPMLPHTQACGRSRPPSLLLLPPISMVWGQVKRPFWDK